MKQKRKEKQMDNFTTTPYNSENVQDVSISRIDKYSNAYKLIMGEKITRELDDLYTCDFILLKPIPTILQYEKNDYVIIQEELNLGEEAKSLQEAEKLISHSIVKLYKKLSDYPSEKLGPYPKKLLSFLKDHIQ